MKKIAIIRTRGGIKCSEDLLDTFKMLGLYRVNYGIIIEQKPEIMGMVRKVKDYIAWGEVDEAIAKKYSEKKYFKLPNMPSMGKGRKFSSTGNLKEKMTKVLSR